MKSDESLFIRLKSLYPKLPEENLRIAKETFDRYLLLAWEVYEDLARQNNGSLTSYKPSSSMDAKVDSHTN